MRLMTITTCGGSSCACVGSTISARLATSHRSRLRAAGTLAPIATVILVLVTLFGALPIYRYVAGETPDGVGSVGMIERIFRGWTGKIAVLVLIGFAATDFVITKTLSAADAAAHLINNPLFIANVPAWGQWQMTVTVFLLVLQRHVLEGLRRGGQLGHGARDGLPRTHADHHSVRTHILCDPSRAATALAGNDHRRQLPPSPCPWKGKGSGSFLESHA